MAHVVAADLAALIGQADIDRLFDFDGDGVADTAKVERACDDASAFADSILLGGYTPEAVEQLVANDPIVKRSIGWIALHYGGQGRKEWRDANGQAPYRAEYKDAEAHLARLSKAGLATKARPTAGRSKQGRGSLRTGEPTFVIAASAADRKGPGGF